MAIQVDSTQDVALAGLRLTRTREDLSESALYVLPPPRFAAGGGGCGLAGEGCGFANPERKPAKIAASGAF
jgi:hypothetical protein